MWFQIIFYVLVNCLLIRAEISKLNLRHEYKFTFKSPGIVPQGSSDVPFFETGGHVIPNPNMVRLTASLPNQQGWIWSKNASSNFAGFMIDVIFKITGRGKIGADGLAVWFVKEKSNGGNALGSGTTWKGLGVLFDTYDNKGQGGIPMVHAIYNDGTKEYHADTDGRELSLNHCTRDIRNRPFPIHARIIYKEGELNVLLSSGLVDPFATEDGLKHLEPCFTAPLTIPRGNYYFGMTSATGGLADDHDIITFEVHSFVENMSAEEFKKQEEERLKYEEEYKKKLEEIKNSNEDDKKKDSVKANDEQSLINQHLLIIWKELSKQNTFIKTFMKVIGSNKEGGTANQPLLSQVDGLRKEILGLQGIVNEMSRLMKVQPSGYQNEQKLIEIHNSIDTVQTELKGNQAKIVELEQFVRQNSNSNKDSQTCSGCISTSLLLITAAFHACAIIGFLIYQKHKENAVKKFY